MDPKLGDIWLHEVIPHNTCPLILCLMPCLQVSLSRWPVGRQDLHQFVGNFKLGKLFGEEAQFAVASVASHQMSGFLETCP